MNFVALDFETASTARATPCSLGVALVIDNEVVMRNHYFINPKVNFSKHCIGVHGITFKDVEDSPEFPEIWENIKDLVSNYPVVAHNASFDADVLCKVASRYGIELPHFKCYCTYSTAKLNFPSIKSYSLDSLCEYFCIDLNEHHNSLCDAEAAAELAIEFLEQGIGLQEYFPEFTSKVPYEPRNLHENQCEVILPDIEYDDTDIEFKSKLFAITGDIPNYSREDVELEIAARGGNVGSITNKTHYLIVGNESIAATRNILGLSRKIEKALSMRLKGKDIKIIRYDAFLEQLNNSEILCDSDELEEYALQKKLGLIAPTITKAKQLYYYPSSTSKTPVHCKLLRIELEKPLVVVIGVGDEEVKIALDYLKEMQPTKKEAEEFDKIICKNSIANSCEVIVTEKDMEVLNAIIPLIDERFMASSSIKYINKVDKDKNIKEAKPSDYRSVVIFSESSLYRMNSEAEPLLCRVKTAGRVQYVAFAPQYERMLREFDIPYNTIESDQFLRIPLDVFMQQVNRAEMKKVINEAFVSAFNFPSFGCCSRYKECSEAGRCLHDDIIYASGACQYKRNLDNGKVFY